MTRPRSYAGFVAAALLAAGLPCSADTIFGDGVDPAKFKVTTFASGLPFLTQGIVMAPDGSLLVQASTDFFGSASYVLRFVDADGDGIADGPGTPVFTSSGALIQFATLGPYYVVGEFASTRLQLLKPGPTPADQLTVAGTLQFSYPGSWSHNTAGVAVRPTPGHPGSFDLVFNVGSQFDGQASSLKVALTGLISGTLDAESLYMVTIDTTGIAPAASNLVKVAAGIRNVFGMAFHPVSGDLYFADNGRDGVDFPPQADELNVIPAAQLGVSISYFGFPDCYIQYFTGNQVGSGCVYPVAAFQPVPNTVSGHPSQGPAGLTFAPPFFPAGFNNGVFIGFSGRNDATRNPVIYYDFGAAQYLHFIEESKFAHPIGFLASGDSLFVADWTASRIVKIQDATLTLSPTSATPSAAAGSGTLNVTTADPGTTWSAASNAAWILITSGANGTGNGPVNYSFGANNSVAPRSGTITISGKIFRLNQSGATPFYSIDPTSASPSAAAGIDSVTVSATPPDAPWVATSNASWISVTAGSSGIGNGTVSYSVAANGLATRSGTLTIAGQTFTVNQAAGTQTPWYNPAWSNRKPITIHGNQVTGTLTNFPVLVSLTTDTGLAASAQISGNDLLFTDSSGTAKLPHEIESFDKATGKLVAWVQVPSLQAGTETTLYLYYGNPGATNQQSKIAVWDSNFKGVWHMSDSAAPASDSSANAKTAALFSGAPSFGIPGQIANSVSFNGASDSLKATSVGLGGATAATWSGWINWADFTNDNFIANLGGFSTFAIEAVNGGSYTKWTPALLVTLNLNQQNSKYIPAPSLNTWHHVALVMDPSQSSTNEMLLYLDGAPQALTTFQGKTGDNTGTFPAQDLYFARFFFNWSFGNGKLNEVRLSSTARSAAWIATEFANQNAASSFYTLSPPESSSGGGTISITVTSSPAGRALTVDGATCTSAPCSYQWTPGTNHTIAVTASPQSGGAGTQYVFANWSDSGAQSHSVTPSLGTTYTANFTTQFQLTTSASAGGSINPSTGYYNSGAVVAVSATAGSGNQFTGFTGALSGTTTPQNVNMTAPLSVTATFAPLGGGGGPAWYDPAWTNRKLITIHGNQVAGPLINFPVLVSLTIDPDLAAAAQVSGNDLLFTDSDGTTKLPHEIESFNKATGKLVTWVRFPSLQAGVDATLYLYYGNAGATNQQNKIAVWDSNFKGVWHLSDSAEPAADSSANAKTAALFSGAPSFGVPGQIANGVSFNGSSDSLKATSVGLGGATAATWSGWINWADFTNDNFIANLGGFSTFAIEAVNGGSYTNWTPALVVTLGLNQQNSKYIPAPSLNTWHHVALVMDPSQSSANEMLLYLDGAPQALTTFQGKTGDNTGTFPAQDLYFARFFFNWSFGNGKLNEVRLSSAVRSAAWIATEFNNQNSASTFFTLSPPESSSGGGGTVAITVTSSPAGRALTVDGAPCAVAPCSYQWTPGTNHTIAVTASLQSGSAGTQYVFANWSDSGAQSHGVTPSLGTTYTANFTTQFQLTTSASGGGTINPPTGYFNNGAVIAVSASANSGYQFTGFSGALSGTTTPQNVTMTVPQSVAATFAPIGGGPSWYDPAWSNRKLITIHGNQIAGPLTNFPVLVSLTTDPDLAATAQVSGNDLLFTDSGGTTKLPHEIESFNKATGKLVAWVQVPSLQTNTDATLYLYYGNAGATNQQNKIAVWDSNFKGVWHLSDSAAPASDSSASAKTATVSGGAPSFGVPGQIANGVSFNGTADSLKATSVGLGGATAATWSGWINWADFTNDNFIANLGGFSTFAIEAVNGGSYTNWSPALLVTLNLNQQNAKYIPAPSLDTWHYVALVMDPSQSSNNEMLLYVDGVPQTLTTYQGKTGDNTGTFPAQDLYFGRYFFNWSFGHGKLNEVRLSSAARSAAWIATEFNNQNSPGTFLTVGPQQ